MRRAGSLGPNPQEEEAMKAVWTAGILIGILCSIWMFVMGFTGWYADPTLAAVFYLVIIIEAVVLVWGLRQTAKTGKRYWGQVGAGTLMAIIGGVILIAASLLFTTTVFPEYFDEIQAMQSEVMLERGHTEEEIDAAMSVMTKFYTPIIHAITGFIGTVVTGIIA
jgi:hypothetical protein